jgi:hypothetical protein
MAMRKLIPLSRRVITRKKIIALVVLVAILGLISLKLTSSTGMSLTGHGKHGEVITVSKNQEIVNGDHITVVGEKFDPTVGIYVAMCKVVPVGELPTPCGGGADMTGHLAASYWISSNPPPYGKGLAIPFKNGGFKVSLKVSPLIGKLDCRKDIACAIYIRADHTRTDDRTYDIKVPLSFQK